MFPICNNVAKLARLGELNAKVIILEIFDVRQIVLIDRAGIMSAFTTFQRQRIQLLRLGELHGCQKSVELKQMESHGNQLKTRGCAACILFQREKVKTRCHQIIFLAYFRSQNQRNLSNVVRE